MATSATLARSDDRARPMTREEKKVILASSLGTVFEWYDFYLYGALAAIIGAQFFSAFDVDDAQRLRAPRLRGGLPRASLRRPRVRPHRRPRRPQVHLPHHHPDHGRLDLPGRPPALLRHDRLGRARHPHRPAHAPGPRARRRVRRRGGLRGRARPARAARLLHELDPDHGDARPPPVAHGHPDAAHLCWARPTSPPMAGASPSCSRSSCSRSRSGSGCRCRNRRPSRR